MKRWLSRLFDWFRTLVDAIRRVPSRSVEEPPSCGSSQQSTAADGPLRGEESAVGASVAAHEVDQPYSVTSRPEVPASREDAVPAKGDLFPPITPSEGPERPEDLDEAREKQTSLDSGEEVITEASGTVDTSQSQGEQPIEIDDESGPKAEPGAKKAPQSKTAARVKASRSAPIDAPGRRNQSKNGAGTEAKPRRDVRERPELICWLEGMTWKLGVELRFDIATEVTVRQGDHLLDLDSRREGTWCLRDPFGGVRLEWDANGQHEQGDISPRTLGLFKLVGPQAARGWAVPRITEGRFLIVVPDSWSWNEQVSGFLQGTSEYVAHPSLRAYSVSLPLEDGRPVSFLRPNGDVEILPCKSSEYELLGRRVDDELERFGPFFIGEPPTLTDRSRSESDIAAVIVGEEIGRPACRPWRTRGDTFEELRPLIADRGSAWFFVRLYNSEFELLDSFDFRFAAGLTAIEVSSGPSAAGPHEAATITFRHDSKCMVGLLTCPTEIAVSTSADCSMAAIPPDPACDLTRWKVQSHGGVPFEVHLLVERIWWRLEDTADSSASPYCDFALGLDREAFLPTSNKRISLLLPRESWTHEIKVGFSNGTLRSVHIPPSTRTAIIPLRELADHKEVMSDEPSILVALIRDPRTGQDHEITLGVIAAQVAGKLPPLEVRIRPSHAMKLLGRLRPYCRPPLRRLIKEIRHEYYSRVRRSRDRQATVAFTRTVMGLVAVVCHEGEGLLSVKHDVIGKKWRERAGEARLAFPDAVQGIREKLGKLPQSSRVPVESAGRNARVAHAG